MLNIRIGNGGFLEYPYDQVGVFNWIITSSIECFHMRSNTIRSFCIVVVSFPYHIYILPYSYFAIFLQTFFLNNLITQAYNELHSL